MTESFAMTIRLAVPFATVFIAGCAVCAQDMHTLREHRKPASPVQKAAYVKDTSCTAATAGESRRMADTLDGPVIAGPDGRPVARVDGFQFGSDGRIKLAGVSHGADGSGSVTVMVPFPSLTCSRQAGGGYRLQTAQALKPLPEFADKAP